MKRHHGGIPPQYIQFDSQVRDIEMLLEDSNLVVIQGAPLAGKSTLLKQVRRNLGDRALLFEAAAESVLVAFRTMLADLGCKTVPETSEDTLDLVVSFFEANQSVVLVDGVDRISSYLGALEYLASRLEKARLIVTTTKNIPASSYLNVDASVYPLGGFTESQALEFSVRQKRVKTTDSSIFEEVYKRVGGIPGVWRALLSSERNIADYSDLEVASTDAYCDYVRGAVSRLPPTDQQAFERAVAIRYDGELCTQIVSDSEMLESNLGIDGYGLISSSWTRGFVESISEETRRWILSHVSSSRAGSKETVIQLKALGRLEDAAREFSKISASIEAEPDSEAYIELSNGIAGLLGVDDVFVRLALLPNFLSAKAIKEEFNGYPAHLRNHPRVQVGYAKSIRSIGLNEDARRIFEDVVVGGDKKYSLLAKLELERIRRTLSPEIGLEGLERIDEQIAGEFADDRELQAELMYAKAVFYVYKNPSRAKELFAELSGKLETWDLRGVGRFSSLLSSIYLANLAFDIGEVRRYRELAQKQLDYPAVKAAFYNEALIASSIGLLNKCEVLVDRVVSTQEPDFGNHSGFDALLNCCFYRGNYLSARAINTRLQNSGLPSVMGKRATYDKSVERLLSLPLRSTTKLRIQEVFAGLIGDPIGLGNAQKFALYRNWREGLPVEMRWVRLPVAFGSDVPAMFATLTNLLLGIHELYARNFTRAEALLNLSVRYSLAKNPFTLSLAKIFLAYLRLKEKKLAVALSLCNEAQDAVKDCEGIPELDYIPAISAICLALNNQMASAAQQLQKIKGDTPFLYLASIVAREFRLPTTIPISRIKGLGKRLKEHFDRMVAEFSPEKNQLYTVITQNGREELTRSNLDDLSPKTTYDLYLNINDQEAFFRGEALDITRKPSLTEFLSALLNSPGVMLSKKELSFRVWREKYNPLIHDSRIYTTVKRIRRYFPAKYQPIRTSDKGYGVSSKLSYIRIEPPSKISKEEERRQLILAALEKSGELTRVDIQSSLQVSSSLAKNDLRDLVDRGLVSTVKKGRLVYYVKSDN